MLLQEELCIAKGRNGSAVLTSVKLPESTRCAKDKIGEIIALVRCNRVAYSYDANVMGVPNFT